jgi:hypothetical protein
MPVFKFLCKHLNRHFVAVTVTMAGSSPILIP